MVRVDVMALHRRAVEDFAAKVTQVSVDQWSQPTPCSEWDVRALVNHVAYEERWTRPIVEGQTIEEVGTAFDGDLLGDDPVAAVAAAGSEAAAAVDDRVRAGELVHLSFGDVPIDEYVMQITADHLIHGWDLAAATGLNRIMDAELVAEVSQWFAAHEEEWRRAGAIGPRADAGGSPQADLLAAFGRHPAWEA